MSRVLNKLNWQIFSNQNRNKSIEDLKRIINKHDGYIINFNIFSDIAISLMIEIEEYNILQLYEEIEEILTFSETKPKNINTNSTKTWWILMNLSFIQGTGDIKIDIPNVPG